MKFCVQIHNQAKKRSPSSTQSQRAEVMQLPAGQTRVLFVSESRGAFGTPKPKRNTSSPTNQEPAQPVSGSLDIHSSCAQPPDNGSGAQFKHASQPRCRPCGYQTRKVSSPLSQLSTRRHYPGIADRQTDRQTEPKPQSRKTKANISPFFSRNRSRLLLRRYVHPINTSHLHRQLFSQPDSLLLDP